MLHFINNHKEIANIKGQMQEMQEKIDRLHAFVMAINDKAINAINNAKGINASKQALPTRKRIAGSYADPKFERAFSTAMAYTHQGMNQAQIAERLNDSGFLTPLGKEYKQGNVSDLLSNTAQMKRYLRRTNMA